MYHLGTQTVKKSRSLNSLIMGYFFRRKNFPFNYQISTKNLLDFFLNLNNSQNKDANWMEKMEKSEYEIQHFGFSAEQMKLERRHIIKQHLTSLLRHLVDSLAKKSNVSEETTKKMNEIQQQVAEKMFSAFNGTLEEIEKLDEKYFSIPENVLLHQDFGHMKEYTKDSEEKLKTEVENLKKQFLENSMMISAIQAENSKYLEIKDVIEEEMKVFAAVQETFTAINIQNTRQMVNSVLSTLES